jgi:transposase-like protein
MDEVLPTGRVSALRNELLSELAPRSAIERMLVDEIARHGAMLEIGEQAELAVLRRSAKELAAMHHDETIADADERKESLLATAVASDAVEKFCRYRRGHEKAVISAIKTLIELDDLGRSASKPRPEPSPAAPPRRRTKDECEVWLLRLAEQGLARCPGCGHNASNWLQERRFLQCKRCRRQYSLRSGTVMAHSRLPLATWFNAIEEILANPAITAAELARRVRIRRNATAQEMHKNILAAMRARDAEQQLAGLSRPV